LFNRLTDFKSLRTKLYKYLVNVWELNYIEVSKKKFNYQTDGFIYIFSYVGYGYIVMIIEKLWLYIYIYIYIMFVLHI